MDQLKQIAMDCMKEAAIKHGMSDEARAILREYGNAKLDEIKAQGKTAEGKSDEVLINFVEKCVEELCASKITDAGEQEKLKNAVADAIVAISEKKKAAGL